MHRGARLTYLLFFLSFVPLLIHSTSLANPASGMHIAVRDLCSGITGAVPTVSMLMVIVGGVIYASGQIMGSEARGKANVWATAALTGAVIGGIATAVTPGVLETIYGADVNCMASGSHGSYSFCGTAVGELCCQPDSHCSLGLVCDTATGRCSNNCGKIPGGDCCPRQWCGNAPGLFCDPTSSKCSPLCGSRGAHCCDVNECQSGLECSSSSICQGCGNLGESCCASGTQCNLSATSPRLACGVSKKCQACGAAVGSLCCPAPPYCAPGAGSCNSTSNYCESCGLANEFCCGAPAPSCSQANYSCQSSTCLHCGQEDEKCCPLAAPNDCDSAFLCISGFCKVPPCGKNNEMCCKPSMNCSSGYKCNETLDKCLPCGAANAQCCPISPGPECTGANTACNESKICQQCGSAAGQPCCFDGTAYNCAGTVSAPLSCNTTASTKTCYACGKDGLPCCGGAGGGCNPGTVCISSGVCKSCGAVGQPCCFDGSAYNCTGTAIECNLTSTPHTCYSCGTPGISCCSAIPGPQCGTGMSCNATINTCYSCGATGQVCCPATPGPQCSSATAGCNASNICSSCGTVGAPCCQPGNNCIGANIDCNTTASTKICIACGILAGQPCCQGNNCNSPLECNTTASTKTCYACGAANQQCCYNSTSGTYNNCTRAGTGYQCQSGFCKQCGASGLDCCAGTGAAKCPSGTSASPLYCNTTNKCTPCGTAANPISCPSGTCPPSTLAPTVNPLGTTCVAPLASNVTCGCSACGNMVGAACCATGTACTATNTICNTSTSNLCISCGSAGLPCCTGDLCPTGAPNVACNPSSSPLHMCYSCGTANAPCCPGTGAAQCPSGSPSQPLFCNSTSKCQPCGINSQICCVAAQANPASTTCISPLACNLSNVCTNLAACSEGQVSSQCMCGGTTVSSGFCCSGTVSPTYRCCTDAGFSGSNYCKCGTGGFCSFYFGNSPTYPNYCSLTSIPNTCAPVCAANTTISPSSYPSSSGYCYCGPVNGIGVIKNSGYCCNEAWKATPCTPTCTPGAFIGGTSCLCGGVARPANTGYCSKSNTYYATLPVCNGPITSNNPASVETPCTCGAATNIPTSGTCCQNTYTSASTTCCANGALGTCMCGTNTALCTTSQSCTLSTSTCVSCGTSLGAPCCPLNPSGLPSAGRCNTPGLVCSQPTHKCVSCGASGQACCPSTYSCDDSTIGQCGTASSPSYFACATSSSTCSASLCSMGYVCNSWPPHTGIPLNTCTVCGGSSQPCCGGSNSCNPPYNCQGSASGMICLPCGNIGQPCCNLASIPTCPTSGVCAYPNCIAPKAAGAACTSDSECSSAHCRSDYDGGMFCSSGATDCEHGATTGTSYASGSFAPDCFSTRYRRVCSSGAWAQSTDCLASESCSDSGSANGGGSCSANKYSCAAGICAGPASTSGTDACGGTVDTPSVTYFYCQDSNGNGISDTCLSSTTTQPDSCSSASTCSAANWVCTAPGGVGALSATSTGGNNGCSGSGSPYKCQITGYQCIASDGTAVDTCNPAVVNVDSGKVCYNGAQVAGSTTYYSYKSQGYCSGSAFVARAYSCDGAGGARGPEVPGSPVVVSYCSGWQTGGTFCCPGGYCTWWFC